jgi:RNA polymerase sigma factor (sigma-70 family)
MATGLQKVLERLRQAGTAATDGQLLGRYVAARDEGAFAALVRRHGPMVLGVCRRILDDFHDTEDAFQATFLVLARKAAAVVRPEALGCWLYQVAYRTALEARTARARRRTRERQVRDMPHPEVAPAPPEDWRPLLDRELARLPEKYRLPVVLCELEGRSRPEVARQLGVPVGTLSSRLAAAHERLARQLARYGPQLAGAALGALLVEGASAAVPAALVSSTVRAAAGAIPAEVAALAERMMRAMLFAKLKAVTWVAVLALSAGAGAVGLAYPTAAAAPQERAAPARDDLEALRLEIEALRKSLQATRARVQALEAEVVTLKERDTGKAVPKRTEKTEEKPDPATREAAAKTLLELSREGGKARENYKSVLTDYYSRRKEADPLAGLADVLHKLKAHPDDEKLRREAADLLERAAQQLKRPAKPETPAGTKIGP